MNYLQEFNYIYEEKVWGQESVSGNKVKPEVDSKVVEIINQVIHKYNIKTILDLGCGDWSIMSNVNLDNVDLYVGVDIVEDLINKNHDLFGSDKIQFKYQNAQLSFDGQFDLVICRDLITHYPNISAEKIINNTFESDFKYILMTTWEEGDNSEEFTRYSNVRKLNFYSDPFNMPEPIEKFYEDESQLKQLSLWTKSSKA